MVRIWVEVLKLHIGIWWGQTVFFSCSVCHSGSKYSLVGHSSFLLVLNRRAMTQSKHMQGGRNGES